MDQLRDVVERLSGQIKGLRERRARLSEADTLRVLITPMLAALGWAIYDIDEVRNEYRHAASDNPVDYALFLNRTPILFVEAKPLGETLSERKWMVQTINYANTSGVEWCVLTNGSEYRFYKVHAQVQVEDKLFLSVVLDDDSPVEAKVRKLSLISRERMGQRAIDALWTEWRVDAQVKRLLEGLPEDDAFVRLLARKGDGLSLSDVRASLRRASIRIDYPGIGDIAAATVHPSDPEPIALPASTESAETPSTTMSVKTEADQAAHPGPGWRRAPMRTQEMFARGLISAGMKLTIKGRPDSEAVVVDGRQVEFKGKKMSFNEWGCAATGWTAIQIYLWALMPDGRLLEALREQCAEEQASPVQGSPNARNSRSG